MVGNKNSVPGRFYRRKPRNICSLFYQRVQECHKERDTKNQIHPFNCVRIPCFAICCICTSQGENRKLGCLLPMTLNYSPNEFKYLINDKRIRLALEYIDKNYVETITLDLLGEYVGLSIARLSSLFKNITGQQFMCHLTKRRIYESVKLLLEGEKNISEICYSVGWNSPATFTNRCKQLFGVEPKRFRELAVHEMNCCRSRLQLNCKFAFRIM